jgi:hypothetical protein
LEVEPVKDGGNMKVMGKDKKEKKGKQKQAWARLGKNICPDRNMEEAEGSYLVTLGNSLSSS